MLKYVCNITLERIRVLSSEYVTWTCFHFGSFVGLPFDPEMEAIPCSETSDYFLRIIWRYTPEDIAIHKHCSEDLKSYKYRIIST
jgi:hypothetical protein